MKKQIFCILFLLLLASGVSAQTVNETVEKIQKYYADISEKARLCETDDERGEFGDLVMNELVINKRNRQWRAVGVYNLTYKFFYQGGDSEDHMYPDQLVFVKVETEISNRRYAQEYLYSDAGALMYYLYRADNGDDHAIEQRVYFSGKKSVFLVENSKTKGRLIFRNQQYVKDIIADSTKIKGFFAKSIKL